MRPREETLDPLESQSGVLIFCGSVKLPIKYSSRLFNCRNKEEQRASRSQPPFAGTTLYANLFRLRWMARRRRRRRRKRRRKGRRECLHERNTTVAATTEESGWSRSLRIRSKSDASLIKLVVSSLLGTRKRDFPRSLKFSLIKKLVGSGGGVCLGLFFKRSGEERFKREDCPLPPPSFSLEEKSDFF